MPATIVAPATAPGQSAVAVLRLSGPESLPILKRILKTSGKPWRPNALRLGTLLLDGRPTDQVLAVWMRAPHSYTGEDAAEIHCHGGAVCPSAALRACLEAGAALAAPGEFTRRAFLNGKMDLVEAEAVADLIGAATPQAAQAALRTLGGGLGRRIEALQSELLDVAAEIEAFLDYPDDDLSPVTAQTALRALSPLRARLEGLLQSASAARAAANGPLVAIVGLPNAGKSSLLNALVGDERAIVTDEPGTTRDAIEVPVVWEGMPVRLLDTAGLRDAQSRAEQLGVERALRAARDADWLLVALDGALPPDQQADALGLIDSERALPVVTKADLPTAEERRLWEERLGRPVFAVSSVTGQGLEPLQRRIVSLASGAASDTAFLLQERPLQCLRGALDAVRRAEEALGTLTLDCASLDVREAWARLGEITGRTAPEDLIDRIFSRFCLGK